MDEPADIIVIYDKQCPACDLYCNLVQISETVGRLVLVDARDGVLYPILKALRNLLLKILGRTKINNLKIAGNDRF